ncbi:peptidoglycan-binding protein [Actinoallomurus oryzae]|uniref:Peptidoglycan-binding protein n=1 Tax=Actinoallomurus oryzae TaxID=502180 RepID=A0ABP8R2F2_9ACTN
MRRWLLPGLGAALAVTVGAVVTYSRLAGRSPVAPVVTPAAAQTAVIRRMDLDTSFTLGGTVGHGATIPFTGRRRGTLTWLPAVGTVVGRGQRLYEVNARPVPLLIGPTPLYRTLRAGVPAGPDVRELTENLRAMGYGVAGAGDTFGRGTEAALKRWQKANGLRATGTLGVGDAVMLPHAVRIGSLKARPGSPATAELFGYTSVRKVVIVQLDPTQADVSAVKPGVTVTVLLPGGRHTAGRVARVSTPSAQDTGAGDDGASARTATVTVAHQAAMATVEGTVQIKVTNEVRRGVLAVPVTALLALAEGGYAVQVVGGGRTALVGVRTGLFAGGMVEVAGTGLAEGLRVVVAS